MPPTGRPLLTTSELHNRMATRLKLFAAVEGHSEHIAPVEILACTRRSQKAPILLMYCEGRATLTCRHKRPNCGA